MTANSENDNTVRHEWIYEQPETHKTLVFPAILGIREVSGHLHTSSTHRMDNTHFRVLSAAAEYDIPMDDKLYFLVHLVHHISLYP